ncbi:hypothetical protein KIF53_03155 [Chromobacterium subtsugae]|uniref:Uncharacterized protein n=1 Tax=Chromobacterium subtsugae TaxID=251747 RepID=A0ABS7FBB5_9NEIS|nr:MULTISPECIES: hypothetical protein [Chromobacterium]MBW7565521.1 hypothetical protein [Chromobacterium subtsugae]MBW8286629.1 hypothetical protein [Chromobacterium subtsugae]WSE90890.1 hypothetical protein U6115_18700 [Chromobacterium subtsugae]WVH59263.1 hypothetical protein U6151_18730 [Chromobacterium subtsugae]
MDKITNLIRAGLAERRKQRNHNSDFIEEPPWTVNAVSQQIKSNRKLGINRTLPRQGLLILHVSFLNKTALSDPCHSLNDNAHLIYTFGKYKTEHISKGQDLTPIKIDRRHRMILASLLREKSKGKIGRSLAIS